MQETSQGNSTMTAELDLIGEAYDMKCLDAYYADKILFEKDVRAADEMFLLLIVARSAAFPERRTLWRAIRDLIRTCGGNPDKAIDDGRSYSAATRWKERIAAVDAAIDRLMRRRTRQVEDVVFTSKLCATLGMKYKEHCLACDQGFTGVCIIDGEAIPSTGTGTLLTNLMNNP